MKEKEKNILTTLLATTLAVSLLAGCGDKKETIEVDGVQYIKKGEEYVELTEADLGYETLTQIYEPGTHYIQYYNHVNTFNKYNIPSYLDSGFVKSSVPVIEGYELVSVQPVLEELYDASITVGYMYIFVNTEKVEVTVTHYLKTDTYYYTEPGTVINEHTLG